MCGIVESCVRPATHMGRETCSLGSMGTRFLKNAVEAGIGAGRFKIIE